MNLRKQGLIVVFCLLASVLRGQVYDLHGDAQLSLLTQHGWVVQHQSMAFDSLRLYISGRAPQDDKYRLYVLQKQGKTWGSPQSLFDASATDSVSHLWPSIAPDGEHLYYVVERVQQQGKQLRVIRQIACASWSNQGWKQGEPIIISSEDDISPLLLADGETLLFSRWVQTSHRDGHYSLFYTRKMDAMNWLLPLPLLPDDNRSLYGGYLLSEGDSTLYLTEQVCQRKDTSYLLTSVVLPAAYRSREYRVLTGRLRDEQTGLALRGTLDVYDALTAQRLFTAYTNPLSGRFRVALKPNMDYRIDAGAEGYSHYYITHEETVEILLSKQLGLTIGVYDALEQMPIRVDRMQVLDMATGKRIALKQTTDSLGRIRIMPLLNKDYRLVCEKAGYYDYSIDLSTTKPIRFSESEFDIAMAPKMTRVRVLLLDAETGDTLQGTIRGERYLRQHDTCKLSCTAKGYFFADTMFMTQSDTLQEVAVRLRPLRQDMVVELRNIQFAYNSYLLSDASYEELDKLRRLMEENPQMEIEVSAHTDDRGSDAYNDRLSSRRGEAVARYLIRAGVAAGRIHTVGYGKRRPLVPNDSEENRERNRRVEFKVLSNGHAPAGVAP